MYFAIVLTLTLSENYKKKVIFLDGRSILFIYIYIYTHTHLELGIGVLILALLICFYFSSVSRSFYQKKKRIHVLLR